jgi:hypothetical protein
MVVLPIGFLKTEPAEGVIDISPYGHIIYPVWYGV